MVGLDEVIMRFLEAADMLPSMAIDHPYVHAWFGAGGDGILQVLRGIKRQYVLMVLK